MKHLETQIHELDVDSIKIFVSRARDKAGFEQMKQSIADVGLKMPIQVRDISERPAAERKRPEGGLYKYELVVGQGRLTAFRELGKRKIPALIVSAPETEIVGRFLAENMIRKPLPWAEKARLVKGEIDAGSTVEEVARKFVITTGHVYKFLRILSKTAKGLEEDVAALPMLEAEQMTTLPPDEQAIVVEVLRESSERQVRDVLRKAKELTETEGTLTKPALEAALRKVDDDLKALRQSLKLARLHHALGVQNLQTLLQDAKFKKALTAAGVNLKRFEEVTAS